MFNSLKPKLKLIFNLIIIAFFDVLLIAHILYLFMYGFDLGVLIGFLCVLFIGLCMVYFSYRDLKKHFTIPNKEGQDDVDLFQKAINSDEGESEEESGCPNSEDGCCCEKCNSENCKNCRS